MLNDTPKTVTEQQRYHDGKREEFPEKGIMKKIKKGYKNSSKLYRELSEE